MKKIVLLGELGRKFGREFELAVQTPAEAIRALCANFPGFEKFVSESEKRHVGYKVICGKESRTAESLHDPAGKGVIRIVPVLAGAGGRGIPQIIIGSILIAIAYFIPTPLSPYLMQAGVSLIISGVVQMLTPLPNMPKDEDRPDNKPSYVFNGAVNTTAQGYPVPVGYGRMIVGSAVISAGISTEELPI